MWRKEEAACARSFFSTLAPTSPSSLPSLQNTPLLMTSTPADRMRQDLLAAAQADTHATAPDVWASAVRREETRVATVAARVHPLPACPSAPPFDRTLFLSPPGPRPNSRRRLGVPGPQGPQRCGLHGPGLRPVLFHHAGGAPVRGTQVCLGELIFFLFFIETAPLLSSHGHRSHTTPPHTSTRTHTQKKKGAPH